MMKAIRPLALLAAAAVALSASASYAVGTIREAWAGLKAFAYELAVKIVAGVPEQSAAVSTASLRGFVVHKAHQVRQLKRQRPRIEDTWRMCPST